MNLKQIFCKHVYKTTKIEVLRSTSERISERYGISIFANYKYYAAHETCEKCKKTNTRQVRKLVLQ